MRKIIESSPLFAETLSYHTAVKTGEVYITAECYGLKIKGCSSGRTEIRGSLHKFFNCYNGFYINGLEHNSNDFSFADIQAALSYMVEIFGTEILQAELKAIEFGLNITTGIRAAEFIKRNIVMLRNGASLKQPIVRKSPDGFKKGVEYVFSAYTAKIYNKGLQYGISDNLLRCEFVATRMRAVKDAKIKLLSDIVDIDKLRALFNYLVLAYADILITEEIDLKALNPNDKRTLLQATNPDYWDNVIKQVRFRKKNQFARIYKNYTVSNHKGDIHLLMTQKFNELIT